MLISRFPKQGLRESFRMYELSSVIPKFPLNKPEIRSGEQLDDPEGKGGMTKLHRREGFCWSSSLKSYS